MKKFNGAFALTVVLVMWQSTASANEEFTLEQSRQAFAECEAKYKSLQAAGVGNQPESRPYLSCAVGCSYSVQALERGNQANVSLRCSVSYLEATGKVFP